MCFMDINLAQNNEFSTDFIVVFHAKTIYVFSGWILLNELLCGCLFYCGMSGEIMTCVE